MPEPQKPRAAKTYPTYHLVRKNDDVLVDFETYTGELAAHRALTEARIDAGWRYVQLQPGQSYAEAQAARS